MGEQEVEAAVALTGAEAVRASLAYLREHLAIELVRQGPYRVVRVHGCDDAGAVRHIGRFLVGAIAQVVRTDLTLQEALLSAGADGVQELRGDVERIIGEDGAPLAEHARTHTRDPWVGEALGQLMLLLSDEEPHPCVPAPMVAAHPPHVEPREHGLDVFGFCHPQLAVVIGEAKTSRKNVAQLLTEAERLFEAIEAGERDGDIRRAVNGLVLSLAPDVQALVVGALWRESRCYLPVVCFETGLDPSSERTRLSALAAAGADCRLIVIQHDDHEAFFEDVARAMRVAVEAIAI